MLKQNSTLRAEAREALRNKWVMAAVAALIYFAISGGLTYTFVGLFLVGGPIMYGFSILMLSLVRGAKEVDLNIEFEGFKDYVRIMGTMALMLIYVFLWMLLLVVPGIIKAYSYAMTPFLLKDDPGLCNNAAIEKSMAMMNGNKMKLFLLDLSFIGWGILSIFTFGIGLFFLQPYMEAAHAAFYEDLKAQQAATTE